MTHDRYNFTTYDRDELRDSFRLAGWRVHDILDRVIPGIMSDEFTVADATNCIKSLFTVNSTILNEKIDYRLRVSFDGAKNGTPEIGVFIGAQGIENFSKKHRIPLVLVSGYSQFKNKYGEEFFDNPALSDVAVGGILNIGESVKNESMTLFFTYLCNWILCGPLFDVFWRTRSFDIHCNSGLSELVNIIKQAVLKIWEPSLDYYGKNKERFGKIRSQSEKWRAESKTCLGFGLDKNFALENFTNMLIRAGDIDKAVSIHQDLGYVAIERRFREDLQKPAQPDEIMEIVEREKPAYAFEENMYTSPVQSIYNGIPSPRFMMRQLGIPFWNIIIDPPESPTGFLYDLLARQIVGNNTAYGMGAREEFSREPGIYDFPIEHLPKEFMSRNFSKANESSNGGDGKNIFVRKLGFQEAKGIVVATSLRYSFIQNTSPFVRRLMCMLPLIEAKYSDIDLLNKYLYFTSLLQGLINFSSCRGVFSELPAEQYGENLARFGAIGWVNSSAISKLRMMAEVEDICERNDIPCRIHCIDDWRPSGTKNWLGYAPQAAITQLGKDGWVRLSFYKSNWGEPFHDVLDGLKNGFLSVSSIGTASARAGEEILNVCCYDYNDSHTLEPCIKRAVDAPHEVYDALYRAMSAEKQEEEHVENSIDTDVLRWFRNSQAEPVFNVKDILGVYHKSYLSNIPTKLKSMLKNPTELGELVKSADVDELCADLIARGFKSPRYLGYFKEFWGM